MYPVGSLLITGRGGFLDRAHVICHCLLIELGDRMILVDTGFGSHDLVNPESRFGTAPARMLNIEKDQSRTAIHQIRAMGYDPLAVTDILMTHLDFDHAGGLADFPWANVHVLDIEHDVATRPQTFVQRSRYCQAQFEHGPKWVQHMISGHERWFGFEFIPVLPDVPEEILFIPLMGHSAGHCGIALKDSGTWLLHCGDAVLCHQELATLEPDAPLGIRLFEKFVSDNEEAVIANQALLRQLVHEHTLDLQVFCSHDPFMFESVPPTAPAAVLVGAQA